jgi:hypothetical protein
MEHTTDKATTGAAAKKHLGGCHCGAVRFEVECDTSAGTMCNCSICQKLGMVTTNVKPAAFALTKGRESLSEYQWGSRIGTRFFCKHCGVSCFGTGHLAQIGGDFVSVNFNALDGFDPLDAKITHWDGRHNNWQAGTRNSPWRIATPE